MAIKYYEICTNENAINKANIKGIRVLDIRQRSKTWLSKEVRFVKPKKAK